MRAADGTRPSLEIPRAWRVDWGPVTMRKAVRVAPRGVHTQRGLREVYGQQGIPAEWDRGISRILPLIEHRRLRVALFGGRV